MATTWTRSRVEQAFGIRFDIADCEWLVTVRTGLNRGEAAQLNPLPEVPGEGFLYLKRGESK